MPNGDKLVEAITAFRESNGRNPTDDEVRRMASVLGDESVPRRSVVSNLARGAATGLSKAGAGFVSLPGLVIPGEDIFEREAQQIREEGEEFFDPQGTAGKVGEIGGRILAEGATSLGGGKAILSGLGRTARGARAARAVNTIRNPLARNVAQSLPFAPVDLAIGAGRAQEEDRNPLVGALGEAALGVGAGGLLGAGLDKLTGRQGKLVEELATTQRVEEGVASIRRIGERQRARSVRQAAREGIDRGLVNRAAKQGARDGQAGAARNNPFQPGPAADAYDEAYTRLFDPENVPPIAPGVTETPTGLLVPEELPPGLPTDVQRIVNQGDLTRQVDEVLEVADEVTAKVVDDAAKQAAARRVAAATTPQLEAAIRSPETSTPFKEVRSAIETAVEAVRRDPELAADVVAQQGARVMDKLGRAFKLGEIEVSQIPRLMDELNLDEAAAADLFSQMFKEASSESGKQLNRLSQLKNALRGLSRDELSKLGMEQLTTRRNVFAFLNKATRTVTDIWRASITSQLSTAMRNLEVGLIRNPMAVFEDTLANGVRAFRGATGWKTTGASAVESAAATFAAFTPSGKQQWNQILAQFPQEMKKLYGAPVFDVASGQLGKRNPKGVVDRYINLLQVFNRAQEMPMRRVAFAGRMAARLGESGVNIRKMAEEGVQSLTAAEQKAVRRAVRESVNNALDVTFARSPREILDGNGLKLVEAFQKIPVLALVHPFPRFLSNSLRFLWDRTAIWRAFDPVRWKAVTKAGGRKEAQEIAKATEGMFLLAAGVAFRASPLAGPKWFQLRVGEDEDGRPQFLDLRPFAPISTFAFLGEMIRVGVDRGTGAIGQAGSGIEPRDFLEAFLGIRRLTGTALFLLEGIDKSRTATQFKDKTLRFVQTVLGGFSTPGRPLKAILSEFDPEEAVLRDVRAPIEIGGKEVPRVFNEFLANIPVVGTDVLPPAASPTRAAPFGQEEDVLGLNPSLLRQLTGATVFTQTPLEAEVRRLGLSAFTRTGVPVVDRATNELLGNAVENQDLNATIESPAYQALNDFERAEQLRGKLSDLRRKAKEIAIQRNAPEVIDEAVRLLRGLEPAAQAKRLDNFQIPQELKIVIANRVRQERR